jgi:sugar/nucleoside kinase (ribokinase family)
MSEKVIVSGVGCSLVDRLFNNISFNSEAFSGYLSIENGDGGLVPGQLVFVEEFEKYADEGHQTVLKKITNNRQHDKINIGGPSIVSIIHAAQLSYDNNSEFRFYGGRGDDAEGKFIIDLLKGTGVNADNYIVTNGETPSTLVLSDPTYDNNSGERIFINSIGAAWNYSPDHLDDGFFESDIVVFGGTALVPVIHDNLTELLEKAKSSGCITIVNTVYDFRNEKANPDKKWPLGKTDESYKNIDLLITDLEEALRLSGKNDVNEAIEFFRSNATGALIITSGTDNVRLFAQGNLFAKTEYAEMPISKAVSEDLKNGKGNNGDTTGCGDNFVGGVIASVVSQIQDTGAPLDLKEAAMCGIVSGGTTTFYMGGMYQEKKTGEKKEMIEPYYKLYKKQVL